MYWIIRGIASRGNIKPDSMMLGSITKNDIWKACIWVLAMFEIKMPKPSEAVMKNRVNKYSSSRLPRIGTSKTSVPTSRDMVI